MGVTIDERRPIGPDTPVAAPLAVPSPPSRWGSSARPRGAGWALVVLLAAWLANLGAGKPASLRARLPGGLTAVLSGQHELWVEALPEQGEGFLAFCRRLAGSTSDAKAILAANGSPRRLLKGVRYRVPYPYLKPELQVSVLRAMLGDDTPEVEGWRHRAHRLGAVGMPSLAEIALWLTGKVENEAEIRRANGRGSGELAAGESVLVPAALLLPALRASLPIARPEPPAPPAPAADGSSGSAALPAGSQPAGSLPVMGPGSTIPAVEVAPPLEVSTPNDGSFRLEYAQDAAGSYAVYRLRPGEALYSSVVIRFTGRILAADVNGLAEEIAARSAIRDVTDIPIGYPVKIPFDLLQPEYLPASDPRRQEYESALQASSRFDNPVKALGLSGVTVILDSGHGGRDVGATFDGVWESLYVHDIMLRVRALLEAKTLAKVLMTTQDGSRSTPVDRDVLPYSRGHRVLTTPPYAIEEAVIGTNLRWYLANSLFRREVGRGVDPKRTVFLSIHADSLHPSLRGAMVYIPDAGMRKGTFGRSGAVYAARSEFRERPQVSFSFNSRVESEGLSRDLARHLISAFRGQDLPVHPYDPIREKIIRRRSQYVPAVLRYNEVPAKVLVEVINLANEADRRLVQTRRHRQAIAEAIAEGLLAYYADNGKAGEQPNKVAAAGR